MLNVVFNSMHTSFLLQTRYIKYYIFESFTLLKDSSFMKYAATESYTRKEEIVKSVLTHVACSLYFMKVIQNNVYF